jgi:DNA-binding NarL/FixJ family response regulator
VQAPTNTGVAATRSDIIRVAVVDDHAPIRSGLEAAIASQPGLACVGLVADAEQLAPLIYRARPGVVVLDYHLPGVNGLLLCRQI